MDGEIKTFEDELNDIISICDEKIKHYKSLIEEYEVIRGGALSLLNLNSKTKEKVISLIDALKILISILFFFFPLEKGIEVVLYISK